MKRSIAIITAIFFVTTAELSLAQMNDKEMMENKKEMMEGKSGMMKMCHSMMSKPSLVSVGDGVVVLSGKKLYKYDANLNLVKEVEINVQEMDMKGEDHKAHH